MLSFTHHLSKMTILRIIFPLALVFSIHLFVVSGFCVEDQHSLLLQLKSTLKFNPADSTKLVSWNQSLLPNCCEWNGVTCDNDGHVIIGLDLSNEFICGGLDDSSALFSLHYLQTLDLSGNNFNCSIPSSIKSLNHLTSLTLSYAGFVGNIPMEISALTSLVSLDLSSVGLLIPDLQKLLQNLTGVKQLNLDGVTVGNSISGKLFSSYGFVK